LGVQAAATCKLLQNFFIDFYRAGNKQSRRILPIYHIISNLPVTVAPAFAGTTLE
jgi:hypothetical protein